MFRLFLQLSEAKLYSAVMHTRTEQITRLGLLNHSRSITVCTFQQLHLPQVRYVLFEFKTAALGGHLSGTWFSKRRDGPDREPFWNILYNVPLECVACSSSSPLLTPYVQCCKVLLYSDLPRVRVSATSNWSRRCLDNYALFGQRYQQL
jgi:hypothetical protein